MIKTENKTLPFFKGNNADKFSNYDKGYKYLNYPANTVLLIKLNRQGDEFKIQYNGVYCSQYEGKGFLVDSFKSKSNHFNANWWYKICSWYYDKNKIYIQKKNHPKCKNWLNEKMNKIHMNQCEKYATPALDILNAILKEASEKLGVKIESNAKMISKDWGEAMIPVIVDKKNGYLLTWNNCD